MVEIQLRLTVRNLRRADLTGLEWSGRPGHVDYVAQELAAAERGEADYLAVCPPADAPVAVGGLQHRRADGIAVLHQLSVHPLLTSCGLGTILIGALEDRARSGGFTTTEIGVGISNPRARALYERLGYAFHSATPDPDNPANAENHWLRKDLMPG